MLLNVATVFFHILSPLATRPYPTQANKPPVLSYRSSQSIPSCLRNFTGAVFLPPNHFSSGSRGRLLLTTLYRMSK